MRKKRNVKNPSLHKIIKICVIPTMRFKLCGIDESTKIYVKYTWKRSLKAKPKCNGFLTMFNKT